MTYKSNKNNMSAPSHLEGERFYLHPAGLSKSRRKIFESWILKEGGEVVTMPEEGLVALVEACTPSSEDV